MSEVTTEDVRTAVGAWLTRLRERTGIAALQDVGWSLDVWAPARLDGLGEGRPQRGDPRPDRFEVDVLLAPLGAGRLEPDRLGSALSEALHDERPVRSLAGLRVRSLVEAEQHAERVVVRISLDGRADGP